MSTTTEKTVRIKAAEWRYLAGVIESAYDAKCRELDQRAAMTELRGQYLIHEAWVLGALRSELCRFDVEAGDVVMVRIVDEGSK
jgi:hypothetical protein